MMQLSHLSGCLAFFLLKKTQDVGINRTSELCTMNAEHIHCSALHYQCVWYYKVLNWDKNLFQGYGTKLIFHRQGKVCFCFSVRLACDSSDTQKNLVDGRSLPHLDTNQQFLYATAESQCPDKQQTFNRFLWVFFSQKWFYTEQVVTNQNWSFVHRGFIPYNRCVWRLQRYYVSIDDVVWNKALFKTDNFCLFFQTEPTDTPGPRVCHRVSKTCIRQKFVEGFSEVRTCGFSHGGVCGTVCSQSKTLLKLQHSLESFDL